MQFGYFPDFKNGNPLGDLYLRLIGYPFGSRRNEVRLVLDEVNAQPGQKILDVGCGDGIWTNYLADATTAEIHGLDVSKHDLTIAKKRAKQSNVTVHYHLEDATKMSFKANSFDTVFSISTLEHTDNDDPIFKEMYRVLKPGGKLIVSMPTDRVLPIVKWWLKLPKPLRFFLQTPIQQANSEKEFVKLVNTKFVHNRLYTLASVKKKFKQAKIAYSHHRYHISFFGLVPHSIVHTLKMFEWNKTKTSAYSFFNQVVFAATFPLFYPWYLLDNLLPNKKGFVIIVTGCKPTRKTRKKKQ
jgi:ubiquinone/menaquinone biosynthesis C-methylase UbiE